MVERLALSMKLWLLLTLLGGQTIYEWVDGEGQSHFTNDERSIAAGAKRRVTQLRQIKRR